AVGPRWQDRHTGQSAPFVRIGRRGLQTVPCADGVQGTIECDTLIASGCLIPLHSVDAIGPMDERLFIDQIDTEWGLRAQARGYRLYGVCDAILFHAIGEASVPAWFAKTSRVSVHAPVRDYYLFRNAITIFFRRKAPWRWRIVQGTRLAGLFIVLTIQVPPRRERLRMILRGIFDALRGQLGPIEVTPAHVR
ncbi:MAG: glycosyltransferase family 2 protein, partial [Casimicrobiaceae bacterium]|nr:glycosyltransferase family 2 protein [Casimicrobiaceae bacterium]